MATSAFKSTTKRTPIGKTFTADTSRTSSARSLCRFSHPPRDGFSGDAKGRLDSSSLTSSARRLLDAPRDDLSGDWRFVTTIRGGSGFPVVRFHDLQFFESADRRRSSLRDGRFVTTIRGGSGGFPVVSFHDLQFFESADRRRSSLRRDGRFVTTIRGSGGFPVVSFHDLQFFESADRRRSSGGCSMSVPEAAEHPVDDDTNTGLYEMDGVDVSPSPCSYSGERRLFDADEYLNRETRWKRPHVLDYLVCNRMFF
ncbi:uncharacterized protein [Euphorbia lathyris]|uniref:uncharacterized protein n=1 Tax=Euphorbia lathyris TaxID=212925 RepID=UPI003313B68F